MGTFSTIGKNRLLDDLTTITAALYSDNPGASGTSNEISGGTPAYARQAITFAAASSGSRSASTQPVFDVPGSNTVVSYVGFWENGTVFLGSHDVTNETFAAQGTYTLTSATLSLTD
jgi:hypothetical protein